MVYIYVTGVICYLSFKLSLCLHVKIWECFLNRSILDYPLHTKKVVGVSLNQDSNILRQVIVKA